jgi:hypothetical protein
MNKEESLIKELCSNYESNYEMLHFIDKTILHKKCKLWLEAIKKSNFELIKIDRDEKN